MENILKGEGFGIAATGMLIVFVALLLISGFIALLPKILNSISFLLPAEHPPHHLHPPKQTWSTDEDELAVAIGFALHQIRKK